MRVDDAINYVISNEIVDDEHHYSVTPGDNGGETNWGIATPFYNNLPDSEPLKSKPLADWTREDATLIYANYIWAPSPCSSIIDPQLSIKLFDAYVNMGPHWSCLLLQRACNVVLDNEHKLVEDGILGKVSLKQINFVPAHSLMLDYCVELVLHYEAIAKENPLDTQFLTDWRRRANRMPR